MTDLSPKRQQALDLLREAKAEEVANDEQIQAQADQEIEQVKYEADSKKIAPNSTKTTQKSSSTDANPQNYGTDILGALLGRK